MKLFAIIQSGYEVHIKRTDNNPPCRQVIIGEADTYEEAVTICNAQRQYVQEQRSRNADRWHDEFRKAEERGDGVRLNQLMGIR